MRVFKLCCDELVLDISSPPLTVELATYILNRWSEGAREHGQNAKLLQFGRLHVTKQIESSRKNDSSQYVKLYEAICTRFRQYKKAVKIDWMLVVLDYTFLVVIRNKRWTVTFILCVPLFLLCVATKPYTSATC